MSSPLTRVLEIYGLVWTSCASRQVQELLLYDRTNLFNKLYLPIGKEYAPERALILYRQPTLNPQLPRSGQYIAPRPGRLSLQTT